MTSFVRASGALLIVASCAGCAREMSTTSSSPRPDERARSAFAAARDRCGVTVVETPEVQRCMRAQGWSYRLPWQ